MARFGVVEGSYTGTSDDVAGRWYITDAEAGYVDKRGRGYESPAEALRELADRLEDVVSMTEIAQRAGTTTGTVRTWRNRHADFPAPLVDLAVGPVWAWADVAAWLARPRRPGRPRKE